LRHCSFLRFQQNYFDVQQNYFLICIQQNFRSRVLFYNSIYFLISKTSRSIIVFRDDQLLIVMSDNYRLCPFECPTFPRVASIAGANAATCRRNIAQERHAVQNIDTTCDRVYCARRVFALSTNNRVDVATTLIHEPFAR